MLEVIAPCLPQPPLIEKEGKGRQRQTTQSLHEDNECCQALAGTAEYMPNMASVKVLFVKFLILFIRKSIDPQKFPAIHYHRETHWINIQICRISLSLGQLSTHCNFYLCILSAGDPVDENEFLQREDPEIVIPVVYGKLFGRLLLYFRCKIIDSRDKTNYIYSEVAEVEVSTGECVMKWKCVQVSVW